MGRATHLARLASLAAVLGLAAGPAAGEDATSECAQGKPIEARMRACSAIIDAKPPTQDPRAEAYRIRGGAHSEKANYKEAIADFTEAIKLKGDDAASYFGRGQSRLAEGDAVGAVDDLTQAIRYSQPTSRLFVARLRPARQGRRGRSGGRFLGGPTSRSQERSCLEQPRPRLPQNGRPR